MRNKSIALSCLLTFAILPGCGGGGDDGQPGGGGPVDMTGAIQKGPFVIGSNVEVAMLDPDTANPTGQSFSTVTRNDLGEFEVTLPGTGAAEIQTTGFYFNEVLSTTSLAPITMRALAHFPASGPRSVHVNALTHLGHLRAKKLVGEGLDFETAIAQAETELRAALPLATGVEVAAGTQLDILGGDSDDNAYLFALSCMLAQTAVNEASGSEDAELQEQMTRIALDLEDDGALEPALSDTLKRGARFLDGDRCTANMKAFVADKGSNATVPDIRRALDFDLDGTADRADADADGDGLPADMDAIVQVAGSYGRGGLAVDQGGALWMWSSSSFHTGVTGCDVFTPCPALPVTALAELGTPRDIAINGFSGEDFAVLLDDDRIAVWGMGTGALRLVPTLDDVTWLRDGGPYGDRGLFFAVRAGGTLWKIQYGNATQVTQITGARAAAYYGLGPLAMLWVLRTDGTMQGHTSDFTQTYEVNGLTGVVDFVLTGLLGFAVDADGGLWKWSPQEAFDNVTPTATQVSMRAPVASLSPDGAFAVLEDGSVWFLNEGVPTVVSDLSDVVRVNGGAALLRDGTVVTFQFASSDTVYIEPVYVPR
jgi:hypothetical protein